MTNEEIMRIALQQSACDMNCAPEDFCRTENVITRSVKNEKARRYLPLPFECDMVSYGSNIVAQTSERLHDAVEAYISRYDVSHCFETPNLHVLDEMLAAFGLKVCFMAEYFLPDVNRIPDRSRFQSLHSRYELRILHQPDFAPLYTGQWSNALCEKRRELDVLGVGAYDGDKLIGLAGCSADCEEMRQIGIDVLPEYRRQGIGAALTARLAWEIMEQGKVPFYCAAWCNMKSVRNAVRAGFTPAWAELTARDMAFVDKMNGIR